MRASVAASSASHMSNLDFNSRADSVARRFPDGAALREKRHVGR
jgi:hypothetical protein